MRYITSGKVEYNKIEVSILRHLYKLRFLNTEQMLMVTYPELVTDSYPDNPKNPAWRKEYVSKYSRVRKEIARLEEFGYIRSHPYRLTPGKKRTVFYSLHNEMFDDVKLFLKIDSDKVGNGWDDDYGDLSTDFYEFPKKINHHYDMVNFFIKLMFSVSLFSFKNEIDYMDNIYSARLYSIDQNQSTKLKPDGEFKVYVFMQEQRKLLFHSWLEVDRKTETTEDLINKFENYESYLSSAAAKQGTPPFIMVYVSAGDNIRRRWGTILNAYLARSRKEGPFLNMFVVNGDSLFSTLTSYTESKVMFDSLSKSVTTLATRDQGFLGSVHFDKSPLQGELREVLGWNPHFVVTENDPKRVQLYLFHKMSSYESQGISRVLDFMRKWSLMPQEITNGVKEIVPVFYFGEGLPIGIPTNLDQCSEEERAALSRTIWFGSKDEKWFDRSLKPISSSINPLTYALH
ncbi:replication-relaxation family protein [Paenibacillus abyssi]|uniref:Uncharacterized protein n=1 Tax=Paenibacillus abyssi TaxID=1340531 RepID=A0A917G1S3_9BACL|nr:replication-relaxation family protein [Paenibacillus abyssi]GGG18691.1 hypothetical protein GCM10010916_39350 [Paenibacillus abyssi]